MIRHYAEWEIRNAEICFEEEHADLMVDHDAQMETKTISNDDGIVMFNIHLTKDGRPFRTNLAQAFHERKVACPHCGNTDDVHFEVNSGGRVLCVKPCDPDENSFDGLAPEVAYCGLQFDLEDL